jgi:hypothetical protein
VEKRPCRKPSGGTATGQPAKCDKYSTRRIGRRDRVCGHHANHTSPDCAHREPESAAAAEPDTGTLGDGSGQSRDLMQTVFVRAFQSRHCRRATYDLRSDDPL